MFGSRRIATRLASTLAFIESHGTTISPSSLSAVTAAQKIGNPIVALVAGSNAKEVAAAVSQIPAISKVLVAADAKYDHYLPEVVSPLVADIVAQEEYTHFVVASSAVGKNILPRVGAQLDLQPISDIISVSDPVTFVRPIYAGNALATVKSTEAKQLVSVRASSFAAAELAGGNAVTEVVSNAATTDKVTWSGAQLLQSERPDLGSAAKVVSGGRGLKSKENFDALITPLADTLGAAIGATRAAVDSGYVDNSLQIGQTGKVVAPEVYVAVGISGAIQHLAGMKDSKKIIAINKDPEAPIFQVADIGFVGDLNEVVPELTQKLK